MEPVYTPVIAFARALFAAEGLRFTITGAENVPTRGGGVVVMNHLSYLDFAYAGLATRPSGRVVRFMCKDSIFEHPVAGPLMRGMKHIPVDRSSGGAAFRAALTALKAGELVGVFPEATISRSFELKEFKTGAVRMAQAARVPLVPLTLWGSQRVWTKGLPKRLGRTGIPITLSVGEPLQAQRQDRPDAVVTELRSRMQDMLDAAQAAYPPLGGDDLRFVPARLGGTAPTLDEAEAMDRADAPRSRGAGSGAADAAPTARPELDPRRSDVAARTDAAPGTGEADPTDPVSPV